MQSQFFVEGKQFECILAAINFAAGIKADILEWPPRSMPERVHYFRNDYKTLLEKDCECHGGGRCYIGLNRNT